MTRWLEAAREAGLQKKEEEDAAARRESLRESILDILSKNPDVGDGFLLGYYVRELQRELKKRSGIPFAPVTVFIHCQIALQSMAGKKVFHCHVHDIIGGQPVTLALDKIIMAMTVEEDIPWGYAEVIGKILSEYRDEFESYPFYITGPCLESLGMQGDRYGNAAFQAIEGNKPT